MTETQKIKETKSQELTEIINEVTETQKSEEMEGELYETKGEHTHVGLGGDNEVKLGECFGTRFEHRSPPSGTEGDGMLP